MATKWSISVLKSPHSVGLDPYIETPVYDEQHSVNDLESTELQRPLQPAPVDLTGDESHVWLNVTRQKFRILETDRPWLDSWVWKQKHGWRVCDSTGEEYCLCKICHDQHSSNKHWFESFNMEVEHRINAEGENPDRRSTTRSGNLTNTSRATMLPLLLRIRLLWHSTCLSSEHYYCNGS
jgi:hypothetical protein